MTEGTGGTPPPPPGYQPPPLPGVAAGTVNVFRGRLVIVSGPSAAIVGVFVYRSGTTPGPGNAPVFWVTSGTADPYGNAVTPTAGVAGTGQFNAGFTILNSSGVFTYSATPAFGNLIASSGVTANGTDSFGNAYLAGQTVYQTSPSFLAAQLSTAQITWFSAAGAGGPWTSQTNIFATTAGGSNLLLNANNQTFIGTSGTCNWADGIQQLSLPAAGGPFISGESFHSVSLAAGLTGRLRVKKLPWNAIFLDCTVVPTSAATSYGCGSLPDATYYPTSAYALPLGNTAGIVSRLFLPTSGGLNVVQSAANSGNTISFSGMYPTN